MVVVKRKAVDKLPELSHHGIKGQMLGKKNGPPYPLDYEAHSTNEKRLNSKATIDGDIETKASGKGFSKETLKKLVIGIGVTAGVTALGVASYKALQSGAFDEVLGGGRGFVSKVMADDAEIPKLGKSIDQIDAEMVASINSDNVGTREGSINCFHTTTSYVLNSVFGEDTKALGLSGVDEVSGLVAEGRDIKLYKAIFNDIDLKDVRGQSFSEAFSNIKAGSTGIIRIENPSGHFVNYEKDMRGNVSIIDAQAVRNQITNSSSFAMLAESFGYSISHIIDFSNASIKDDADKVLKHIVSS